MTRVVLYRSCCDTCQTVKYSSDTSASEKHFLWHVPHCPKAVQTRSFPKRVILYKFYSHTFYSDTYLTGQNWSWHTSTTTLVKLYKICYDRCALRQVSYCTKYVPTRDHNDICQTLQNLFCHVDNFSRVSLQKIVTRILLIIRQIVQGNGWHVSIWTCGIMQNFCSDACPFANLSHSTNFLWHVAQCTKYPVTRVGIAMCRNSNFLWHVSKLTCVTLYQFIVTSVLLAMWCTVQTLLYHLSILTGVAVRKKLRSHVSILSPVTL